MNLFVVALPLRSISSLLLVFKCSNSPMVCRSQHPHLQGAAAVGRRRAERSYSTFKVRRGSREKIPLVQGKEQRPRFAGATMKRYPTSKVRETQVRG